ncbi:MAG TPA: amidohydrolase family protein, partial [Dehalococcoidia bacterium]|nr:amidohydrolase family protein [Dehalococcoidia bacterium]
MIYNVISADDHIDLRWLPKELWTKRLPARLRDRGPRVEATDGGPYWVCDGKRLTPWGAYTAAQGSGAMWALELAGVMEEGVLRPTTPELRLADMDRDGVDATVMYGPTDPFAIDDPELRAACYLAYNDWLTEFCGAAPERLIGVAQLSCEDPDAAATELKRVAKLGFRHVNVLAARATPPVYDEAWESFWALAKDSGLPVGFHLAVEVKRTRSGNGIVDRALAGITGATQLMDPIAGLILTGVLDRHPGLRVVMAEAGLAWVPHMMQRLDTQYVKSKEKRLDLGSAAGPKLLPSEYFRNQIW